MGNHLNSTDGFHPRNWLFANSFYLPFLEITTAIKFMAAFEIFAIPQHDIITELVLDKTKNLFEVYYIKRN